MLDLFPSKRCYNLTAVSTLTSAKSDSSVIVQGDKAVQLTVHTLFTNFLSNGATTHICFTRAGKQVFITMETNRKWWCEICLQV